MSRTSLLRGVLICKDSGHAIQSSKGILMLAALAPDVTSALISTHVPIITVTLLSEWTAKEQSWFPLTKTSPSSHGRRKALEAL
jgi:hypothetical protein